MNVLRIILHLNIIFVFSYDRRLGVRVFCSAAISKRHSATVLETVDGIMITVGGCLNRSRTHQNGFPSEVCSFLLYALPLDLRKMNLNPKCSFGAYDWNGLVIHKIQGILKVELNEFSF